MKAKEVLDHFLSRANWIDRADTVDRIIIGDPEKEIRRCAVTWSPSFAAIRAAVKAKADLLLVHEPTFWDHRDVSPETKPECAEKLAFLLKHKLVIIRNHDCWDAWPEIGIPWTWAKFLGLEGLPAVVGPHSYQQRYDIKPIAFGKFAAGVAKCTAKIGEPVIEAAGDLKKPVSKIGIGTGCYCNVFKFIELGCDCCIVCDDGENNYWRAVQYAEDIGVSVITVNHGTSEEPGMVTLAQYLRQSFPSLTVEHLPHGACFRLVPPG
jgi:putative NIF3 family GTP cyclohydrolase 1 type 2